MNLYGLRCFMWLMLMLMSGICANRHLWIQSSLPRKKIAIPRAKKRRRDRISSDTGRMCSRAVRISKASASKLASLRWQGQACPENNVIPEPSICWKNCLAKKTFKKNVEALEIIRAWFYMVLQEVPTWNQDHPGSSRMAQKQFSFCLEALRFYAQEPSWLSWCAIESNQQHPTASCGESCGAGISMASLWHLYLYPLVI